MTWREMTVIHPAFVQWVVARFGPLPDGAITQEDYERYIEAYKVEGP